SIFVIGFGLLVFVECPCHEASFMTLPIGSQEQTDCYGRCVAVILRSNQYRLCLRTVFVVLGLVVGLAPNTTPLQKNQLAAPLAVLFLLCVSRFVLFLLSYALLVIVLVPNI
ncbi:MAG TPA: hypothetical protein VN214_02280, partial [Pseudomonas sp.]|nr:hypothetical protein [Pseudomonas sp.]